MFPCHRGKIKRIFRSLRKPHHFTKIPLAEQLIYSNVTRQQLLPPYTAALPTRLPMMKPVKYTSRPVPSAAMLLHAALIVTVAVQLLRYPVFG